VFTVTYCDGSVQDYGSECINKILANAPALKTLFSKNSKRLIKLQDYLAILSAPLSQAPRGQEYYGSGLYFIADSEGKCICFESFFFHPTVDEKNETAPHYRVKSLVEHVQSCDKNVAAKLPKLQQEIQRIESFLGKIIQKGQEAR
jgi:hypothetical protein